MLLAHRLPAIDNLFVHLSNPFTFLLVPRIGCIPRLIRMHQSPRVMELWQQCAQDILLIVARAAIEVPAHHYSTMALRKTPTFLSCPLCCKAKTCGLSQRGHCTGLGDSRRRLDQGSYVQTWLLCVQMKSASSRICTVLTGAFASVGSSTPPAHHF